MMLSQGQSAEQMVSFDTFQASVASVPNEASHRLVLLTARQIGPEFALLAVLGRLEDAAREAAPGTACRSQSGVEVLQTVLESSSFPSFTPSVPQAHWFERAIFDFFRLAPEGHPRFKSLILHEPWSADMFPLRDPGGEKICGFDAATSPTRHRSYEFLRVRGAGVYEIPVGPIHAGIIEPGHFRFSCLGEIIENLEIRLGYQHRGLERRVTEVPWQHVRFVAENASSDTTVANAIAHAHAVEQLCGIEVSPAARALRVVACELERLACHIGDLGGICSDIGFLGGATTFGRLRGTVLGMAERLGGSRFLTNYVRPGGVRSLPSEEMRHELATALRELRRELSWALPGLLENQGALDRMEGVGTVRADFARDFGLVGPAGRASAGLVDAPVASSSAGKSHGEGGAALHRDAVGRGGAPPYDVRAAFGRDDYPDLRVAARTTGDVCARVAVRAAEVQCSLDLVAARLDVREGPACVALPEYLPAHRIGIGLVEAWRGELLHLIVTGASGEIVRYAVKDPSFNNWTGLAIAARGELVFDFPLCNKSFGLSYSGNDL